MCSVCTWCSLKYARMRFCSLNCTLVCCNACVCLYVCLYACQRTIFWIWLSPSILFRDRVSLYDHSPFCSMIDAYRLPEIFFPISPKEWLDSRCDVKSSISGGSKGYNLKSPCSCKSPKHTLLHTEPSCSPNTKFLGSIFYHQNK